MLIYVDIMIVIAMAKHPWCPTIFVSQFDVISCLQALRAKPDPVQELHGSTTLAAASSLERSQMELVMLALDYFG